MHPAYFTRRQPERRVTLAARHMNLHTDRDDLEQQAIAQLGRGRRAAHQLRPHLQTDRRDDIPLLPVLILQHRQPGRADRVILDADDLRLDAVLVALKIHIAQKLLVPPADATRGDPAVMIAAAGFLANTNETPFRRIFCNLIERRYSNIARRRR